MNDYNQLARVYNQIKTPPVNAPRIWYQERGKGFERLLNQILTLEGLEPRTNYRPEGEEIDGSFVLGERVFLIEAKWHADPLPASSIYQFKGKVDGKLVGTLGVFISISGYAKDAVDALEHGKVLNLLLLDQKDFEYCLESSHGFKCVIRQKLRKAAEEGTVYWPYSAVIITPRVKDGRLLPSISTEPISTESNRSYRELIIVCEGKTDELLLGLIVPRVLPRNVAVRIVTAGGKSNLAKIAHAIAQMFPPTDDMWRKLVIVADSDGDEQTTRRLLERSLPDVPFSAVFPDPELEIWLMPGSPNTKRAIMDEAQLRNISPLEFLREKAQSIDLDKLRITDRSFDAFMGLLESVSDSNPIPHDYPSQRPNP